MLFVISVVVVKDSKQTKFTGREIFIQPGSAVSVRVYCLQQRPARAGVNFPWKPEVSSFGLSADWKCLELREDDSVNVLALLDANNNKKGAVLVSRFQDRKIL